MATLISEWSSRRTQAEFEFMCAFAPYGRDPVGRTGQHFQRTASKGMTNWVQIAPNEARS